MKTISNKCSCTTIAFICMLACWLVPISIWASVEVDGIYYDLNTSAKTAAVASNPNYYTGAIDIPSSFVYNGSTYNVKSISSRAFLSCSEMTSINFPSSVTTIGSSAFERCTGLAEVVIGGGVTSIDYEAFKNCSNLRSLTLPSSLKTIENEAFSGCTSLAEIIAKRTTPPTIVSTTFDGVDKTACMVYVPEGCKSSYSNATNWKTFNNIVERKILATGSCGDNVTYTIYSDMTMVIAGSGAMKDRTDSNDWINADYYGQVKRVIIEDGVTYIGNNTFWNWYNLTSVSIGNSVTSIGDYVFYYCTGLVSVTIPGSLTSIGWYAFANCSNLASVTISNGVTAIGGWSFLRCISLTSVTIPNSVTSIGYGAFSDCTSLTSITIPNSVKNIQGQTFQFCGLTSVTIPNSVTSIGNAAFWGNTELTSVTIPSNVTTIGENPFQGCTSLSTIIVDSKNNSYDSRNDCNAIIETSTNSLISGCKNTVIPLGVTSIGNSAFYSCESLTTITIPNSVTSIGEHAFYSCTGLTSIIIPSSVSSIESNTFIKCSFDSIIMKGKTPLSVGDGVIGGTPFNCSLYVPIGSKSEYENDDFWNMFQNILEYYPRVMVAEESTGSWCGWDVRGLVGMAYMREHYFDSFIGIGVHNGDEYMLGAYDQWMSGLISGYPSAVINRTQVVDPNSAELEQDINEMFPISEVGMTLTAKAGDNNTVKFATNLTFLASQTDAQYDMAFVILEDKLPITYSNLYAGGENGPMGGFENLPNKVDIEIDDVARAIYPSAEGLSGLVPQQIINDKVYTIEYEAVLPYFVNRYNVWATVLLIDHATGEIVQAAKTHNIEGLTDTDIINHDNAIYVEHTEGRVGGTKDISVKLKNSYPVRGFQFTLELPEGASINSWSLSTNRLPSGATLSDKIATQKIEGNKITVACSLNYGDATFTGYDGEIATVNVTFDDDMEVGTYPIYLTACDVTTASGADEDLSDVTATLVLEDYVVGDANGDGKVRIGDATTILNYIVGTTSDNFKEKAADANGDGKIRIGDATTILNIIVNQ